MEQFLKISATLLLLVITFHRVILQEVPETTDTPRRTIDPEWLRKRVPSNIQAVTSEWASSDDHATEESGAESGNDRGVASGSFSLTEENIFNDTEDQPSNETTVAPESQDTYVSTTALLPTSDGNIISVDNSTTAPEYVANISPNSTNNPNNTDVKAATSVPEKNATTQYSGIQFSNGTEIDATNNTDVVVPESTEQENVTQETTTASPNTTTTTTSPNTTTTTTTEGTTVTVLETTTSAPVTSGQGNLSDKGVAGTAERGFGSKSDKQNRKSAWGAVLGTFVAIAVVGLVAYVILKKKHQKAFSHSKLEEEFPSDPVLRLDSSEPLDLNFGRAAYYNPGLQGDNIQMSPFPRN